MYTLGTAGHIDHGKTTLCRLLTGKDTDRLLEEKKRGISIELGFADLIVPSGRRVGIVDVPGHERFIRNMVAGVWGIQAFLFTVAADEGVMPQTREHLDILELLGVKRGLFALSKCDLCDPDWVDMVEEDLRSYLAAQGYGDCAIHRTAATDGASIEALKKAIDELLDELPPKGTAGFFRLPVDRIFSIKGHGTIVTGTVATGTLRPGSSVELLPGGRQSRVRSIQSFDEEREIAVAGERAALNLPDLSKAEIDRGVCCCSPGVFQPTSMLDVSFHLLRGLPKAFKTLKQRSRVRLYVGTAEVLGRLQLLEGKPLEEGQETVAQLRLESPVVASRGERFLIRSFSPLVTIGGGIILDAQPPRRKARPEVVALLRAQAEAADLGELLRHHLAEHPQIFVTAAELSRELVQTPESLEKVFGGPLPDEILRHDAGKAGSYFLHQAHFEGERNRLAETLRSYHDAHPMDPGMARAELHQSFAPRLRPERFNLLMASLTEEGRIEGKGKSVRLAGYEPRLSEKEDAAVRAILASLQDEEDPFVSYKAVAERNGLPQKDSDRFVAFLSVMGKVTKLPQGLVGLSAVVDAYETRFLELFQAESLVETSTIKEHLGLSRKGLIPLLEHFDQSGLTLRVGNARRLRRKPATEDSE